MARIELVPEDRISPEAKQILTEIEQGMGRIPNLFKTYAHHPPLLRANWQKLKATMMEGSLPRKLKETIALLVSQDNGCDYCIKAHSGALRALRVGDDELAAIREGRLEEAGFEEREHALVALMRKANLAPHDVSDEDFRKARDAGASDAEIVEAYGVMETFAGFNRFLDSVEVAFG